MSSESTPPPTFSIVRYKPDGANKICNSYKNPAAQQQHPFFHRDFPRGRVYGHLLARPTGIVPGYVRVKPNSEVLGGRGGYKYQYNHSRQRKDEVEGLPKYDGSPQTFNTTWSSMPTAAQTKALAEGKYYHKDDDETRSLAPYFDEHVGTIVYPFVVNRGVHGFVIVNRATVTTTGIQGVALLRTCQQIHEEASPILYGANAFVFDTCPTTSPYGSLSATSLSNIPELIPGLTQPDGSPMPYDKVKYAMKRLFNKTYSYRTIRGQQVFAEKPSHLPEFDQADAMAVFFRRIGSVNASHITNITIEGVMKTAENISSRMYQAPIGFDTILGLHTVMLKHACPQLTTLTIHQREGRDLWQCDPRNRAGKSDSVRVSEVVERIVLGLRQLQHLNLGNYMISPKFNSKVLEKPWGGAVKWPVDVERRYEASLKAVAGKEAVKEEEEEEEKKVVEKKVVKEVKFMKEAKIVKKGDAVKDAVPLLPGVVDDESFPELGALSITGKGKKGGNGGPSRRV